MREHDRGKSVGNMEKNKKSCARGKENKRKRKEGEGKAKEIIKDEKGQHERESKGAQEIDSRSKRGSTSTGEENCVLCTAKQERGAAEEQRDRGQGCARERSHTQMSEGMQARDRKQGQGSKCLQERENAHSRDRT